MRQLIPILFLLSSCGIFKKPSRNAVVIKPVDTVIANRPIEGPADIPLPATPLNWPDRRPIGMGMLASNNGVFNSGTANWALINGSIMDHGRSCLNQMREVNAQGIIIWDLEGQEYPHAVSYIGDPRLVHRDLLDSIDSFFKLFSDAGFKTGVTLRPDTLVFKGTWVYHYTVADHYQNLSDKIAYARSRWGCSLFYVDSNVGEGFAPGGDNTGGYGNLLNVGIFQRLAKAYPDCLIIPEHQDKSYYKFTAPFNDYSTKGFLMPDDGFEVLKVGDDFAQEELNAVVKRGSVLMFRAWYPSPEIFKIKQAYADK